MMMFSYAYKIVHLLYIFWFQGVQKV